MGVGMCEQVWGGEGRSLLAWDSRVGSVRRLLPPFGTSGMTLNVHAL